MNTTILHTSTLADLSQVAQQIVALGTNKNVWLFEGEMGAGKTTLIKAICRVLGVLGHVQSPTFALVNEYLNDNGEVIYHFDFYRIKSEIEAMDIGIEEYFYSGNLCFVEWPSQIPNLLPESYLKINIQTEEGGRVRYQVAGFE